MITVDELKKKALRLYPQVLSAHVAGESIFPKAVPANKVLPKDFAAMHEALRPIIAHSKERTGYGYGIDYEQRKTRSHGVQTIPTGFVFDTKTDYLKFISAEKEFQAFAEDVRLILQEFPSLADWLQKYPLKVISNHSNWPQILLVCKWFKENHEANRYYIRELPIPVHTKFIEENEAIISVLLEVVAPVTVCSEDKKFPVRFGLLYDEPLMRMRVLDEGMAIAGQLTDLALPVSQMADLSIRPRRVIISENKMTFLTLPPMPDTVAIWGHGYRAGLLKHLTWLKGAEVIYWGDLDVHGFEILNQVRRHYSETISMMMDKGTFRAFKEFVTAGKRSSVVSLPRLTTEEALMHRYLGMYNLRLEQERISHGYILERIEAVV
ncbi:Wadjet anti-phage system protein JetD domain-containing protein [Roseivirga sp. BDSF3-8]|uniref:Wadjet anti-phage system protein JetD domain-containing protein n=1 Tax=Roseivirga sp. BDSF3-8 TaxID=3241598 RepID=UPI00353197E9